MTLVKSLATLIVMALPAWVVFSALGNDVSGRGQVFVHLDEPGATVSVDDQRFESGSDTAGPFDVNAGEHRVKVIVGDFPVYDRKVTVEPGGRAVVRAGWDRSGAAGRGTGPVPVLDAPGRTMPVRGEWVTAVAATASGNVLLSAGNDGSIACWDAATGRPLRTIAAHDGKVTGLVPLADGRRVVSTGDDLQLRVWDVTTGKELLAVPTEGCNVPQCVSASADGRFAALGTFGGLVQVFDLTTGREMHRWNVTPAGPGSMAFSPDGSTLLVGPVGIPGKPHPIRTWDVKNGLEGLSLKGHNSPVWSVAFLPDGRRAVSGSSDHTLRVWDVAAAREVARFDDNPGAVMGVAVSPDGRYAVAGTGHSWNDGWAAASTYGARLWDIESGTALGHIGTAGPVRSVAFSPDGLRVVAGGDDRLFRSWELPTNLKLGTDAGTFVRRPRTDAPPAG